MYSSTNFKTKKALKEAVAAGRRISVYQPNDMFGRGAPKPGESVTLEGPHAPQPHSWYATAVIGADGCIDKVT